ARPDRCARMSLPRPAPDDAAPDPAPDVSVVIATLGGPQLARCLDALLAQTGPTFEVIVVDGSGKTNANTKDAKEREGPRRGNEETEPLRFDSREQHNAASTFPSPRIGRGARGE